MCVCVCVCVCTTAAVFFCTYELTKRFLGPQLPDGFAPLVHMAAATAGEVVSSDKCIYNVAPFYVECLLEIDTIICIKGYWCPSQIELVVCSM